MAVTGVASHGGFSYAQAAKGRASTTTSQTPSSKFTSGNATPATGTLSDIDSGRDWADEVETNGQEKIADTSDTVRARSKSGEAKNSAVERTKSEDKAQNHYSELSSPDLAASASSHDDASSAQNGSSQTSWEAKSQASEAPAPTEPAWIAERKERQNGSQGADSASKSKPQTEEVPPKPVALHDAPPPAVNPWMKRAEDAKVKSASQPQAPRPAQIPSTVNGTAGSKESQKPGFESKKKPASVAANLTEQPQNPKSRQAGSKTGLRPSDVTSSNITRPLRAERQTASTSHQAPPSVKDEVSWPTPDTIVQEKERRLPTDEKTEEEKDDEISAKPRKKQEWKPVPVVPNIIWETPGVRERGARGGANGERVPRGGANARGRGGFRPTPNGTNGPERSAARNGNAQINDEPQTAGRGRADKADRDAMPPPPKPERASSGSSRTDSRRESRVGRQSRRTSVADTTAKRVGSQTAPPHKDSTAASNLQSNSNLHRSASLRKVDTAQGTGQNEEKIPEPIPRPTTFENPGDVTINGNYHKTREAPLSVTTQTDGRKTDYTKDPTWNGSSRGSRRGRGRGGARDFTNGHAHSYNNGQPVDFVSASPYGVPASPSAFSPHRGGNHHNTYPGHNRGGWRGGNNRAQSIQMDNFYSRFGAPYSAHPHLAPLQTYQPTMVDYNGYPMTALPYPGMLDQSYLIGVVITQLDYYFSFDNLLKDMYLRKNMDSQGFVYLEVIASFNRIKQLTTDKDLLRAACFGSETVEIRVGEDGKERLRKVVDHDRFILPKEERFASARTDGPSQLDLPERPMFPFFSPQHPAHSRGSPTHPFSPSQRPSERRAYDYNFAPSNGMTNPGVLFADVQGSNHVNEHLNGGEESRGRPSTSPTRDNNNNTSPMHHSLTAAAEPAPSSHLDADTFSNEHVEQLTVCLKVKKDSAPYHHITARSFSNGSIDPQMVAAEAEKQPASSPENANDGEPLNNGVEPNQKSEDLSTAKSSESPDCAVANDVSVFWIKDNDQPVGTLPSDLTPEPYVSLRMKALDQRSRAATGTCPYDLDVLYQFWSHFLIRNFNNNMYSEFKHFATTDAKDRHSLTGHNNLIKYYDQALNSANSIPILVAKDYVELAKAQGTKTGDPAFKRLHRSWRDGALNLRNRKRLTDLIDAELKQLLEA